MAHKKGQGSSRNGRDSNSQRLGVKRFDGNIVTGGSIADFKLGWDFLTIKYDRAGDQVWLRRFDSPWHSDDKPAALAVGPENCLYVAGFAQHRPPVQGVNAEGPRTRRTDKERLNYGLYCFGCFVVALFGLAIYASLNNF